MEFDEDTVLAVFFIGFLAFAFTLPCTITACIAASRTRAWNKDKRARNGRRYGLLPQQASMTADPEAALESESDSDHESDYLDSEDERNAVSKREQKKKAIEERDADLLLSTSAKFIKEWKSVWRGPGGIEKVRQEAEAKAEVERRKIAREAVREYLRMERKKARKARKAAEQDEQAMELPSYGKAVSGEKQ
ncbi:uncharacterized protein AB675_6139 [Cyphellophora attinorum]|uniref:Uncharacterized protein n=1 Tax=Cyphellophora attinorum TaxID=1664694 RepID=A0A0N1H9C9_9EURO|nr:uncharacterized protein AB675_6139 [Phialophora attinorum]KPI44135.1 hypothetical protein AB675_6139 [Phialophora attinorum]